MFAGESTTWIAVGASNLAALLLVVIATLLVRLRADAGRSRGGGFPEPSIADLRHRLERAQEESVRARGDARRAREEADLAQMELRWARTLSQLGVTVDLEGVLARGLEGAANVANASASMIVLARGDGEPLVATYGLSNGESSRELVGLPPEGGQVRAVALAYRYREDGSEGDKFRLRGGLAVPLAEEGGDRLGTLAIFWRRIARELSDDELGRLEALARALVPALRTANRFEETRALVDLDEVTGLHGARFLKGALACECARARRYERRVALLLFGLDVPLTSEVLAAAGQLLRTAVRSSDPHCHLGEGCFAVILPESALADAERVYSRLQFALESRLGSPERRARLPAGIVEFGPEDDPVSFLERAQRNLARAQENQRQSASGVNRELDLPTV
jgi:diguanylate cyclase (GGDEF)-like protein